MGSTAWSDEHYRSHAAFRLAKGLSPFAHDADIREQKIRPQVHPDMDPALLKGGLRESRDSALHPKSRAVAVLMDVTGSMGEVPRILQRNLTSLFGLCLRQGYLDHPAILVGAIGDATCDAAPLQVGQFESGNEIEEDLSRLFLEGGGGGQQTESYELGLYFLARKTALDCFEKRGEKGYAFLIGDEMPYPRLKRREVERLVGDTIDADVPVAELIAEARKRWEIFYIIPKLSHYYNDSKILARWRELLGQSVIKLEDPSAISELIASTIGLAEETVDKAGLAADLKEAGVAPGAIDAVASALKGGVGRDISGTGLRAL